VRERQKKVRVGSGAFSFPRALQCGGHRKAVMKRILSLYNVASISHWSPLGDPETRTICKNWASSRGNATTPRHTHTHTHTRSHTTTCGGMVFSFHHVGSGDHTGQQVTLSTEHFPARFSCNPDLEHQSCLYLPRARTMDVCRYTLFIACWGWIDSRASTHCRQRVYPLG
jgi:hypothetical protein